MFTPVTLLHMERANKASVKTIDNPIAYIIGREFLIDTSYVPASHARRFIAFNTVLVFLFR